MSHDQLTRYLQARLRAATYDPESKDDNTKVVMGADLPERHQRQQTPRKGKQK